VAEKLDQASHTRADRNIPQLTVQLDLDHSGVRSGEAGSWINANLHQAALPCADARRVPDQGRGLLGGGCGAEACDDSKRPFRRNEHCLPAVRGAKLSLLSRV
jgi:hypothetical protein